MTANQTAINEIITSTIEIATLPEITIQIIQVVQDPRSTAHDLHKIVRNDPALSSRVLRVVNSAFYGLPGQIGSIDRAIMLLGLNAVKNIAIAASLSKMFDTPVTSDDFTGKRLWTHSVAVGAANKLVTGAIGLALPDESFLAGLIHDIGLVAILQCKSQAVPKIVQMVKAGLPFLQAENETIGTNHQEIGAALAAKWKFPRSFQFVTGYHHQPRELAEENRLLTSVTCLSDLICSRCGFGLIESAGVADISPELANEIGISPEQIEAIADRLEEELEVVKALIE